MPVDTRTTQAKRLWDLGYGRELKIASFEEYLATIPEIPTSLIEEDPELPLLTLDDPRVPRAVRARLVDIEYEEFLGDSDGGNLIPYDERHVTPSTPYWFRAHDGRVNRGHMPLLCREKCTGDLLAGTANVLLALFTHHEDVVGKVGEDGTFQMMGPGSVIRNSRSGLCSLLRMWSGHRTRMLWGWNSNTTRIEGTVVFRRQ